MSCCPQTTTQNGAAEVWPCQEITEGFAELQGTRRREESEAQSNQVFLPGQLGPWGHAYVAYFPCFTFEWTQPCRDLFSAYLRKDLFASRYCKFGPEQIFMTVARQRNSRNPKNWKYPTFKVAVKVSLKGQTQCVLMPTANTFFSIVRKGKVVSNETNLAGIQLQAVGTESKCFVSIQRWWIFHDHGSLCLTGQTKYLYYLESWNQHSHRQPI